ncbi:hypothetical protein B0H11DRAFT_1951578 [Mycena galericulata]|nr:hypothetical protein B0H11DRAFT_1951578 [Mycena galericulata]
MNILHFLNIVFLTFLSVKEVLDPANQTAAKGAFLVLGEELKTTVAMVRTYYSCAISPASRPIPPLIANFMHANLTRPTPVVFGPSRTPPILELVALIQHSNSSTSPLLPSRTDPTPSSTGGVDPTFLLWLALTACLALFGLAALKLWSTTTASQDVPTTTAFQDVPTTTAPQDVPTATAPQDVPALLVIEDANVDLAQMVAVPGTRALRPSPSAAEFVYTASTTPPSPSPARFAPVLAATPSPNKTAKVVVAEALATPRRTRTVVSNYRRAEEDFLRTLPDANYVTPIRDIMAKASAAAASDDTEVGRAGGVENRPPRG